MNTMPIAPRTMMALPGWGVLRVPIFLAALLKLAGEVAANSPTPSPSSGASLVITPDEPFNTSGRALGTLDELLAKISAMALDLLPDNHPDVDPASLFLQITALREAESTAA